MAIQRLFPSSRALIWAFSIASLMPLMVGGAAAVAQTAKAGNEVPLSNRSSLSQVNLSGNGMQGGAPKRRFGGGSRDACSPGPQSLAMISPADNVTVTTAAQPSFMLWVTESKNERDLEFVLRDSDDLEVYSKMLKLSDEAGVVTLDMSQLEDAPSLTKGEDYYVYLSWVCDLNDRSKDIVVEGQLSPVDFDQWVTQHSRLQASGTELQTSDPFFQIEQSVEVGLWHDAMVQLNRLRQDGTTSAIRQQAQQRWEELLEADDGLNVIADETRNVVTTPLAIADIQEFDLY